MSANGPGMGKPMSELITSNKILKIKEVSYFDWIWKRYGITLSKHKAQMRHDGKKFKGFFIYVRAAEDVSYTGKKLDENFQAFRTAQIALKKMKRPVMDALLQDGAFGTYEIGIGSEWE